MAIILKAKRLLNGKDKEPLQDHVVVVEGNQITAVGPEKTVTVPPGARIIDLGEGTVLPGLIDLHSHPTYYFRRPDVAEFGRLVFSDPLITLFAVWQLQKDLEAGITTVRDVGAVNRLSHEIERARQKGFVKVPRICAAGRLITPTGGHVHDRLGFTHQADGVDGVRRAVREEMRAGAAVIKLATNGADFLCPEIQAQAKQVRQAINGVEFSQEEIDVAVLEAHRAGLKLACHTRWRPSVAKAVKAGVDTIEHGTFMSDGDMRGIAERGIVWVPTIYQGVAVIRLLQECANEAVASRGTDDSRKQRILSQETPEQRRRREESRERRRHLFKLALQLGVKIGAGTDIFRPELEFASLVGELEMFVAFGMTPAEAIQAGTRVNAEALGWEDRIGTIEAGKLADMIFVEGDPLDNLAVLRHPKLVMLDGQIVVER